MMSIATIAPMLSQMTDLKLPGFRIHDDRLIFRHFPVVLLQRDVPMHLDLK